MTPPDASNPSLRLTVWSFLTLVAFAIASYLAYGALTVDASAAAARAEGTVVVMAERATATVLVIAAPEGTAVAVQSSATPEPVSAALPTIDLEPPATATESEPDGGTSTDP